MMQEGSPAVEVQNTSGGKIIRIRDADGRERRIEISDDGQVTTQGAAPGQVLIPPAPPAPSRRKALPDGLVDMMGIIFGAVTIMTLGGPIVKAWARRFERRSEIKQQALVEQRLASIEQAIESVAIEVERISEGQRFTTKLLSDRAVELEQTR